MDVQTITHNNAFWYAVGYRDARNIRIVPYDFADYCIAHHPFSTSFEQPMIKFLELRDIKQNG